jgi:hypothetical protein
MAKNYRLHIPKALSKKVVYSSVSLYSDNVEENKKFQKNTAVKFQQTA